MAMLNEQQKILVVDDDRNIREMLERFLSFSGYEVLTAPNGLKLLSTLKVHKPDLILLDIMMSWVDGFELCRIIKKSDDFNHIPVIFLSACNDRESVDKGFTVGCTDYLTKPFDNDELLTRIQKYIH